MRRVGLTQKQETFCLRYFETSNATESAKLAGYSPRTAAVIASENLKKLYILARINELRQKAEDDSVAGVLERKQVLSEIVRGRFMDFLTNLTPDRLKSAALQEVRIVETSLADGVRKKLTTIRLHNSIQAIAELNKMERIYEPDGAVIVNNNQVNITVASEQGRHDLERVMSGERT